jgi:WD40 repeat protein
MTTETIAVCCRPSRIPFGACFAALLAVPVDAATAGGWRLTQPKEIASFRPDAAPKLPVFDFEFSHDGKSLATFHGFPEVKVWDIKDKKCVATFSWDRRAYHSVRGAFASTGVLLLAAEQAPVGDGWELWKCNVEMSTKELVKGLPGNSLVYRVWPDKNMVVIQDDPRNPNGPGPLRFVDLTGKKKDLVVRCEEPYTVLSFSPDRTLVVLLVGDVSKGKERPLRIVDVVTGKTVNQFLITNPSGCYKAQLSSDNKVLATLPNYPPEREWVYFWDVGKGKEIYRRKAIAVMDFLEAPPDGQLIAILSRLANLHLFDVKNREWVATYGMPGPPFQCLRFSPDGKAFAIGDSQGMVRVLETSELK